MADKNQINSLRLKEWISKHFSEGELKIVCFHLGIDFDNIRNDTRDLTIVELITYCERRGILEKFVKQVKNERPKVEFPNEIYSETGKTLGESNGNKLSAEVDNTPLIPFTNREDEISQIMSHYASAYYLLDAPSGYGKTELLKELERRFTESGWETVYVPLNEQETFEGLIRTLADKFNVATDLKIEFKLPLEDKLSRALNKKWQVNTNKKEGVVLLIDFDNKPSLNLISSILNKLIPALKDNLSFSDFAYAKHNPFRVIMTGRYLATRNEINNSKIPIKILQLSPFNYNVIRDSVNKVVPDDAKIPELAAHLFHLTGGHPGGIAETLTMYQEVDVSPERFSKFLGEDVWKRIIRTYHLEIRDGIAENERKLFSVVEKLSFYRCIDYKILENFIGEYKEIKSNINNQYDLADKLTETYMLSWKGRFLRDGITRRLLAMRLSRETPDEFVNGCCQAMKMCESRIKESNASRPEIWTIEYLFQYLQQHVGNIDTSDSRQTLADSLFDMEIPKILHIYLIDRKIPLGDWLAEKYALLQALDEDWEFQFNVNYYLRNDRYHDGPFGNLKTKVEQYFNELQLSGGK